MFVTTSTALGTSSIIFREWVYFVLALAVSVFTIVSLINTFRYHRKLVFELLPLSMNVFSMFMLTILHVLTKSF